MNASGMSDGRVCRWNMDGKPQIDLHKPRLRFLNDQVAACVHCASEIFLGDDGFWYAMWSAFPPGGFVIQEEPW